MSASSRSHKRIRVVLAKMGMDSHFRGAIMVARYLMGRGMEVIYVGNQLPEQIAEIAVQEDADVVGLSSLSGNHMLMVPRVLQGLRDRGMTDVLVMLGGVIPREDQESLIARGVDAVFTTGSSLEDIAVHIEDRLTARDTISG